MANARTGKPLKQAIEHHMDAQGALIEQKPHLKKEHEIDHLYLALREANQDLEGVIRVISKALGYSHTLPAGPEFPRTPPPAPARGRRSRKPRKKKCG